MMFPHPDTIFEVRTLQNQDLLTAAAQARLVRAAAQATSTPSLIDSGRSHARRVLDWFASVESTRRSTRQFAKAWR